MRRLYSNLRVVHEIFIRDISRQRSAYFRLLVALQLCIAYRCAAHTFSLQVKAMEKWRDTNNDSILSVAVESECPDVFIAVMACLDYDLSPSEVKNVNSQIMWLFKPPFFCPAKPLSTQDVPIQVR